MDKLLQKIKEKRRTSPSVALLAEALFAVAMLAVISGITAFFPNPITVSSSVNGKELPVYCVETGEKKVALTFDAAWGNKDTERILNLLEKHGVHATFFMTGGWVEKYPEDVMAILQAGHDLGNHSESHKNMSQLSVEECREEIEKAHTRVQQLTGYEMFLFRPPYGDYDNHVIRSASESGYYSVLGDVDTLDWKDYGTDSIVENVLSHEGLGSGSIIVCRSGAKYTADALEQLIVGLQERGYEIVPVSELIYRENYHMNAQGRQIKD